MKRTIRKLLKILAVVIVVFVALDALIVFGVATSKPEIHKADAIIVLGAAINTPALYNRSLVGLKLYEQGKGRILILSGGRISDKDISEAQYMQKVIRQNTKAPVQMALEQKSHTTYENILNSKELVPDVKSVIVVSDKFHVARGVLMARAAGYRNVTWASPDPYYYSKWDLTRYYLREMVAMVDYLPKFLFK